MRSTIASATRFGVAFATVATIGGCARSSAAPDAAPTPAPDSGVTAAAAAAFPTTPPALSAPAPLPAPTVVERRLANGLRVLVVRQAELPLVDVTLAVRTGAESDPANRAGLATLTANLLDEGTRTRTALQIAEQAALLGASLRTNAGWDATTISLHGTTAALDSALALMADVALAPSFPTADLERLRAERLTSLVQLRDRGPAIADRIFNEVVYGPRHPYGRAAVGTEATTRAITQGDIQRFFGQHYRPNNAVLIAVGDIEPDDFVRRAERLFGTWEPGPVLPAPFDVRPPPTTTQIYVVDKPGAPQSSVRIGSVGVARATDDFFPLTVMNTLLGGSFTSRLNQNLRETRGYTYGAGSSFSMRREPGPFLASAEVTGTKTDSALIEFMKELNAIRDTVPMAELEKAKQYLELQLPSAFETTGGIASQLLTVALYDLPLDYFASYSRQIRAVSQADVHRVARQYVRPEALAIVIVGDRASIEPALRRAGIAPVSVRTLDPQ